MTDAYPDGPPRATQVLDPAELPKLYPCPATQPHHPHVLDPQHGATLVRYRCDGRGGIILPTDVLFTGERQPTDLRTVVGEGIGAGSVCWVDEVTGERAVQGVFDSSRARVIADEICEYVEREYGPTGPRLGMATTAELLGELRARIEMDWYSGGGGLGYTTTGGRPEGTALDPGA